MRTIKFLFDDELMAEINKFRNEYKSGIVPIEYFMPFIVKLGLYYLSIGGRIPEIRYAEIKLKERGIPE